MSIPDASQQRTATSQEKDDNARAVQQAGPCEARPCPRVRRVVYGTVAAASNTHCSIATVPWQWCSIMQGCGSDLGNAECRCHTDTQLSHRPLATSLHSSNTRPLPSSHQDAKLGHLYGLHTASLPQVVIQKRVVCP